MKIVQSDDVRAWLSHATTLTELTGTIGRKRSQSDYLDRIIGVPLHLRFVIERMAAAQEAPEVPLDSLDSIPFYSLCRGLFLPLSGMAPEKAAHLFGLAIDPPPDTAARETLLNGFLHKNLGLTIEQKIGCVLGDPFLGQPSTFRRDSLLALLQSMRMARRVDLLDRLTMVGDVAVLYAESRSTLRKEPPLTSAEVLETLRWIPAEKRNRKYEILRGLFARTGKLEAFFLAKLLMRKAGFGFDYQGPLVARALAEEFGANPEQVAHAMALTDAFEVARVLAREGPEGLRAIQLQPLVPVRPALAGGTADEISKYPVWVERKYDGIRLMLHKSTDANGAALCGAYTRTRGDWLEMVAGLDMSIKVLPAPAIIVDGELYGTVMDLEGVRPATVYEVYAYVRGDSSTPVQLKFAAFDLIYLNGRDLTSLPLSERRKQLSVLLAPVAPMPLPIPLQLSEGLQASNKEDVNRLYHHFRAQGHEGIIAKDVEGTYRLSERDPTWLKRKPEVTLDLVLTGAVLAVTTKEKAGMFGSYVIGAKAADGTFQEVGDVAGLDRVRDLEIQGEILRDGLMTGQRIERKSSSGVRPGVALRPSIVVTVKFEGIARDLTTQRLALRSPKIVMIRSDKSAEEIDGLQAIEELFVRQRVV